MSTRLVSKDQLTRLHHVAERKSRFALMGEFSAGKSSILNLLMAREVAQTQVTATHMPAIWWQQGASTCQQLFDYSGQLYDERETSADPLDLEKCAMVRMAIDTTALDHYDIIDTPGISDPMMSQTPLLMVARHSDFIIWCTTAVQAWRQSEVSAWEELPQRLGPNSILAVTGIDRLSPRDLKKVLKRVENEAAGRFRTIVPIATLEAMRAVTLDDVDESAKLWRSSGGEALLRELDISISASKAQRRALLQRYKVDNQQPAAAQPSLAQPSTPHVATCEAVAHWDALVGAVQTSADLDAALKVFRGAHTMNATLDALLSLPDRLPDLEAIKLQLRGEIEAFSKTAWSDLAPG